MARTPAQRATMGVYPELEELLELTDDPGCLRGNPIECREHVPSLFDPDTWPEVEIGLRLRTRPRGVDASRSRSLCPVATARRSSS
jgi:hypothetical protein